MVEGGMKCVKYILFAFNLLFFLAGLALIIAGAVVQGKLSNYFDFFGASVNAAAILLIVVGVIIFIIGFFGCCGAYKENYCMTMTFAVLLGIVFILEIAAGIAAYIMRNQVEDMLQQNMSKTLGQYGQSGKKGVTDAWDLMQMDFDCCGVSSYKDWANSTLTEGRKVPDSCCIVNSNKCGTKDTADVIYRTGCLSKFTDWVKSNILIIGGVGIGLAFVQVFGILLACCLARSIKKEYEVV